MKNKHLTLSDRIIIQEMLERKESLRAIAMRLEKSTSSISREIKRNRYKQSKKNLFIECTKVKSCMITHACGDNDCRRYCSNCIEVCNSDRCPEYEPNVCYYHTHAPFVCNGCDSERKNICHQERYYYDAKLAQSTYEKTLSDTRCGVSLSAADMELIDAIVSPLLLNGHSIQSIYSQHEKELPCSMRTLYNYVDSCYLTARNIDLPRKVHYKKRYRHDRSARSMQSFCEGRTYTDFKEFIQKNPDLSISEMDTVVGGAGSKKVLLTLYVRNCNFMMAFLLPDKTQHGVIRVLNNICERVGIEEFRRVFGVILTDYAEEKTMPKII